MPEVLLATPEMATEYARWFVNRLAYTRQSDRPHSESGRHYYYRPRAEGVGELGLELDDVRRHLAGEITLGILRDQSRNTAGEVDGDRRRLQAVARRLAEIAI